jgi:oxygen-dependent protoporphyrinogen oxidase
MIERVVTRVAIVGGGISGLAAAWALRKRRVPFVVLEAAGEAGGVIRTETKDGFLLEGGPDAILAQKVEGLALIRELGLGDRLLPTNRERRSVFVLHHRRLHPLPEGMALAVPTRVVPFLRSGLFSWPGKLRMGLDLVLPARSANGDESIAAFLRRRFGQEAVDRLGEPLLAGIHAGDPERLSILATFPRFREIERRHGSLVRGMWRARPPGGGSPPAAFYSLRAGLRELVTTLVERLGHGAVRTQTSVRRIGRQGDGFALDLEGGERVEAQHVIVAAPGPKVAPALADLVPGVARTLGAIPFASSATVLLGYRREDVSHPLDGYGMVVPRAEGLRTSAVSFVSTKFEGRAPAGHVLLRGFLGGVRDGSALALSDDEMVDTVRREMGPLLGLRGEPVVTRVFRWPGGTPQLEVGHLERIAEAERRAAAVPGLHLTGAGLRSTGIPDAIADATKAAETAARP